MSASAIEQPPPLGLLGDQGLTLAEQRQADALSEEAKAAITLAGVALVLGGAFLLYRAFAVRQILASMPSVPQSSTLRLLAMAAWHTFQPTWLKITVPAVAFAYTKGMIDAQQGNVPPELLMIFAEQYARDIGEYYNQTSAQALDEGFNAYVNRKLPKKMAAERVLAAYGLSPKQMRGLVAAEQIGALRVTSPIETRIGAPIERYTETQLIRRAQDIGDNEAFTAMRRGKQLTWMYLAQRNLLPAGTKRTWITAHDERVCQYCGPLHGVSVEIAKPFETHYGPVWVPALHPNCRCDIALEVPTRALFSIGKSAVSKADWWSQDWDEAEHPRDDEGQFTFKPDQPRTAVRTAEPPPPLRTTEAPPTAPAPLRPGGLRGGALRAVSGVEAPAGPLRGGEQIMAPLADQVLRTSAALRSGEAEALRTAEQIVATPLRTQVEPLVAPPETEVVRAAREAIAQRIEEEIAADTQMIEDVLAQIRATPEVEVITETTFPTTEPVFAVLDEEELHYDVSRPLGPGRIVTISGEETFIGEKQKTAFIREKMMRALDQQMERVAEQNPSMLSDEGVAHNLREAAAAEMFREPRFTDEEDRKYARAMGIERKVQTVLRFDQLSVDPDRPELVPIQQDDGTWKLPAGNYVVDAVEDYSDAAYPVRYLYIGTAEPPRTPENLPDHTIGHEPENPWPHA